MRLSKQWQIVPRVAMYVCICRSLGDGPPAQFGVLVVAAGHFKAKRHVDAVGDDDIVGAHADIAGKAVRVE